MALTIIQPSGGGTGLTSSGSAGNVLVSTGTAWASQVLTARVGNNGVTLSGTITPTAATVDQYNIIGLTGNITLAAPSGTPTDGQKLILRITDAGTSVNITWDATYRVIGVVLPTSTTANKTSYIGCLYNSTAVFWDVVAVGTQV